MFQKRWCFVLLCVVVSVMAAPKLFHTEKFRIGIEYEHSLPMYGGSDRYRHRNNCEPFFVTITATAKSGFVITYLDVTATVDDGGEVIFNMVRGQTGSKSMVFQLISNQSDFLSYSYLTYGIKEEEYRKIANIITIPMTNQAKKMENSFIALFFIGLFYTIHRLFVL